MADMTEEEKAYYREMFELFDRDENDKITLDEVVEFLRAINVDVYDDKIPEIFKQIDADNSGAVTFDELTKWVKKHGADPKYRATKDDIKQAFLVFDRDRNGYIQSDELLQLLKAIGQDVSPEEADEMIAVLDHNKDNRIDLGEFTDYLTQTIAQHKKRKS